MVSKPIVDPGTEGKEDVSIIKIPFCPKSSPEELQQVLILEFFFIGNVPPKCQTPRLFLRKIFEIKNEYGIGINLNLRNLDKMPNFVVKYIFLSHL